MKTWWLFLETACQKVLFGKAEQRQPFTSPAERVCCVRFSWMLQFGLSRKWLLNSSGHEIYRPEEQDIAEPRYRVSGLSSRRFINLKGSTKQKMGTSQIVCYQQQLKLAVLIKWCEEKSFLNEKFITKVRFLHLSYIMNYKYFMSHL